MKGTLNVLESCTKVPSIKRVVITSSMASVMFTAKPLKPDVVMDETWFSSPVLCEEQKACAHCKMKFQLLKYVSFPCSTVRSRGPIVIITMQNLFNYIYFRSSTSMNDMTRFSMCLELINVFEILVHRPPSFIIPLEKHWRSRQL